MAWDECQQVRLFTTVPNIKCSSLLVFGGKTNAKKTTQDMFMTIFLQCMASLELLPVVCIFKQILTLFSVTTKSIFIFLTLNLLQKD